MIIPKQLQIFTEPVQLSDKDFERLKPLISSWSNELNEILGKSCEADLERLIVIELMTAKRGHLVDRLVNRLSTIRKKDLRAKVKKLL